MNRKYGFDFNRPASAAVLFNGFILKGTARDTAAYGAAQEIIDHVTSVFATAVLPKLIQDAVHKLIEDTQTNHPVEIVDRKLIGRDVLSPAPFTRLVIDAAGNAGKEVVNPGVEPGTRLQDYPVVFAKGRVSFEEVGCYPGTAAEKTLGRFIDIKG